MVNFEVYFDDKLIFQSNNHWLHPIFELENQLRNMDVKPDMLQVRDKIIGRAAALLLVRLGIKKIHASCC